MPRKTKKVVEIKQLQENENFQIGDFCYFVNNQNKIMLGEVYRVHENENAYTVIEQTQFKYCVVPHSFCADSQKDLKGKKRR